MGRVREETVIVVVQFRLDRMGSRRQRARVERRARGCAEQRGAFVVVDVALSDHVRAAVVGGADIEALHADLHPEAGGPDGRVVDGVQDGDGRARDGHRDGRVEALRVARVRVERVIVVVELRLDRVRPDGEGGEVDERAGARRRQAAASVEVVVQVPMARNLGSGVVLDIQFDAGDGHGHPEGRGAHGPGARW